MFTPAQVSEMLNIPPSSLRRLAHEFAASLSKSPGRHRRYSEQDINTLRRVREMTGRGLSLETIRQQLTIVEAQPPAGETLAMVPTIAQELSRLDEFSRSVFGELEKLRAAWQEDHARLEKFSRWAALPWWKRFFTPPPK